MRALEKDVVEIEHRRVVVAATTRFDQPPAKTRARRRSGTYCISPLTSALALSASRSGLWSPSVPSRPRMENLMASVRSWCAAARSRSRYLAMPRRIRSETEVGSQRRMCERRLMMEGKDE
jgi:hypothetical protein